MVTPWGIGAAAIMGVDLARQFQIFGDVSQEAMYAIEDLNRVLFEYMTKGQRRRYVKRMVREEIWRRRHGRRD